MNSNPWDVASIDEFSFLNCPECTFRTKEKRNFQDHATENHPLSSILFPQGTKVITFSKRNELDKLKVKNHDQKCKELVLKHKLPGNLQVSIKKFDKPKNFNNVTNFEQLPNTSEESNVTNQLGKYNHSSQNGNLSMKTIHEGRKKFKCQKCNACFDRKTAVEKHISIIHEKPFKCRMCNKSLANKGSLLAHVIKYHESEIIARKNVISLKDVENFVSEKCLKDDIQKSDAKKLKFTCEICKSQFANNHDANFKLKG